MEINRKHSVELRQEIDSSKMEIHKIEVHIEETLREIGAVKRTCDNKENEISAQLNNNQEITHKN